MIRCTKVLIQLIVVMACLGSLHAQQEFGEDSKLNTNLAMSFSVPLNPIAKEK